MHRSRDQRSSPVDRAAVICINELTDDIYETLRSQEAQKMPNVSMIDTQPEIRWSMRPRLLGFLIEAQGVLHLDQATFSLAVSIMDRYASRRIIYNRHFQLVGCVALWIAAKYIGHKHNIPPVQELVFLCANTFGKSLFREMERHMVTALDWDVGAPTALDFVELMMEHLHYLFAVPQLPDFGLHRAVAVHISECALFDRRTLGYPPSVIAASAVELSCVVMDSFNGVQRDHEPVLVPGSNKTCVDTLVEVIAQSQGYFRPRHEQQSRVNVPAMVSRFADLMRRFDMMSARSPGSPTAVSHAGHAQTQPYSVACLTPAASDSEDSGGKRSPDDDYLTRISPGRTAHKSNPVYYGHGHGHQDFMYHTNALPPTPDDTGYAVNEK